MSRYSNIYLNEQKNINPQAEAEKSQANSVELPRGFNGSSWDAKHMTNFMMKSNYSNYRDDQRKTFRNSQESHKRSYSMKGDHFFRTTKDNRNQSKIGCTPIFPLVSIAPIEPIRTLPLTSFFNANREVEGERPINGRNVKLRCQMSDEFKFEGNAVKYQCTDPLTLQHEDKPSNLITGYHKQRMNRLINKRHPHGMTGIDNPQNPQSKFYQLYQEQIRVREEPNSHRTFFIDRDWNQKKRSVRPVDDWKHRKTITIRQFRNEETHGYNILTNRKLQD